MTSPAEPKAMSPNDMVALNLFLALMEHGEISIPEKLLVSWPKSVFKQFEMFIDQHIAETSHEASWWDDREERTRHVRLRGIGVNKGLKEIERKDVQ